MEKKEKSKLRNELSISIAARFAFTLKTEEKLDKARKIFEELVDKYMKIKA